MRRKIMALLLAMTIATASLTGCGSSSSASVLSTDSVQGNQENSAPESATSTGEVSTSVTSTESDSTGFEELEAIGDVDVEKELFDVTLTVPKDFVGETTQEELDETVAAEEGFKSATLNDDGSVTYVMTKDMHKKMVDGIAESINQSLQEMVESSNYPNITAVTANDDYTSFTVTTRNSEPDLMESFAVLGLYMYGGMYAIFNGETADNIHVDFVNADSGEIISSADSKDAGN